MELGRPLLLALQPLNHCPQEVGNCWLGRFKVCLNVDRREQTAEADQVLEVVDVVRIPVVPADGAKIFVLDTELFVFLPGPAQFLVDVAGGHQRAIGVNHLFPVQRNVLSFTAALDMVEASLVLGIFGAAESAATAL